MFSMATSPVTCIAGKECGSVSDCTSFFPKPLRMNLAEAHETAIRPVGCVA